jgi:hypothetical protein
MAFKENVYAHAMTGLPLHDSGAMLCGHRDYLPCNTFLPRGYQWLTVDSKHSIVLFLLLTTKQWVDSCMACALHAVGGWGVGSMLST